MDGRNVGARYAEDATGAVPADAATYDAPATFVLCAQLVPTVGQPDNSGGSAGYRTQSLVTQDSSPEELVFFGSTEPVKFKFDHIFTADPDDESAVGAVAGLQHLVLDALCGPEAPGSNVQPDGAAVLLLARTGGDPGDSLFHGNSPGVGRKESELVPSLTSVLLGHAINMQAVYDAHASPYDAQAFPAHSDVSGTGWAREKGLYKSVLPLTSFLIS